MKNEYTEKLYELFRLSKHYDSGLSRDAINSIIDKGLNDFCFSEELYGLYEHFNGGDRVLFNTLYSLDEAIDRRVEYLKLFKDGWLNSWFPLGKDDVFDFFVVLPKEDKQNSELYYVDFGGGDANIYLLFYRWQFPLPCENLGWTIMKGSFQTVARKQCGCLFHCWYTL